MRKLSYEEVRDFIQNIDDYLLLSNKYINSKEKLDIKCKNNHIFKMTFDSIRQGRRCLECQGVIRWDYEKVKYYIELESNSNYKLLSTEYLNMHKKLKLKCENEHIFNASFDSFYRSGARCPRCKGCGKLTYELVKNFIEIESKSGYKLLSTSYTNNREKLELLCPEGHIYNVQYSSFQQGVRCKTCAEIDKIKRQTHTFQYVKKTIESEIGYKLLSDIYIDNETHLIVTCNEGHSYKTSFGNFISGARCKKCYHIRNSGEGNYKWNPEITDEEREIRRNIKGYSQWRFSIYERDNYSCQCCGSNQSGNLVAHHLDGYNWCKEKRTDVENGVTLCEDCHADFHLTYGYGDNTKEQYYLWINNKIKITS